MILNRLRSSFGHLPTGTKILVLLNLALLPLGLVAAGASLQSVRDPAHDIGHRLLIFLPIVIWIAASVISFLLVNGLLLRPLRQLRDAVDGHKAGAPFNPPFKRTPAREILELEQDIRRAFDDQTRATREVHHRVKNNLQIVASLISLHARSAPTPAAASAYSAIQRRVDALAIVHRSHYAELDTGGGIELRRLISEIAANLRASGEDAHATPPISLTAIPMTVTQDTAIALGFLITEIIELSSVGDMAAPIEIRIAVTEENPNRARIEMQSSALRNSSSFELRLSTRYARVIEGLGRQLRTPIEHDGVTGLFCVEFPILAGIG